MTTALRWTGIGKLVGFYRHFAFAGPRTTTAIGAILLVGDAAIYLFWLLSGQAFASDVAIPGYLLAYFVVQAAGCLLAVAAMVTGRRLGWMAGALLATASILVYGASRIWAFSGLTMLVGWWDYPLGTFTMLLSASYLALHAAILTKVCVAYPQRRHWEN